MHLEEMLVTEKPELITERLEDVDEAPVVEFSSRVHLWTLTRSRARRVSHCSICSL